MRLPLLLSLALPLLAACATPPVPEHDPRQAWIDLHTYTGKVIMAERLDGQRLDDGRYFQAPAGSHELVIRYDYEVSGGGGLFGEPYDRLCYLTVRYDHFVAGQRYVLQAQDAAMQASARLYDPQKNIVAEARDINCL